MLCCQINTLQIFIRRVTQCVPLTSHAGLNTNTRMMLHQESGRFTNLSPLKAWHAGPVLYNTAVLYEVESHTFTRLLRFNTNFLFAVLANVNIL